MCMRTIRTTCTVARQIRFACFEEINHLELSHTVCEQLELWCDKNNVNREKENNEKYLPVGNYVITEATNRRNVQNIHLHRQPISD